jgi:hypothetical protein
MRDLPVKLEVFGPTTCTHPGSEEVGWESIEMAGGPPVEFNQEVEKYVSMGFDIWINGFLQDTQIPGAYLIRKI